MINTDNRTNGVNILVTLDKNYIPHFNVMLSSLLESNGDRFFDIYMLHSTLSEEDIKDSELLLCDKGNIHLVKVDERELENAPTTDRYPKEMYYRIFAARYLPESLDRILYLDPDVIVNKSIDELYSLPMDNAYFAAASHIGSILHIVNEIRLDMDEEMPYINSGVMLINLDLLRRQQNYNDVFVYINEHKGKLILPDQDVISGLYGDKIISLDPYKYNMTERLYVFKTQSNEKIDIKYICSNTVIIHYCGRNKPWKNNYIGRLDVFYLQAKSKMEDKLKSLKNGR